MYWSGNTCRVYWETPANLEKVAMTSPLVANCTTALGVSRLVSVSRQDEKVFTRKETSEHVELQHGGRGGDGGGEEEEEEEVMEEEKRRRKRR
ncbi:hypothetical protein D4764_13G0007420 [Takifugu flavidus]|uniref:Uncharacterized protein n=1 Tax=Takifugu flavidus TaxID=433684 RepID=A0A5C6PCW8_9TELE|nr:hypothetical protein D4764_13G0007420 [Takifugu flavidus]